MRTRLDLTREFNVTTYLKAWQYNPALAIAFEEWTHKLRLDDDEFGPGLTGTLNWLFKNAAEQAKDPDGLLQTFIVTRKDDDKKIAATITLVSDDRGIGAEHNIGQDAMVGFFQVDNKNRGEQIGHALLAHVSHHVQDWMTLHPEKENLRIACFSTTPTVIRKLKNLGFESKGMVFIKDAGMDEELFTLDIPQANKSSLEHRPA